MKFITLKYLTFHIVRIYILLDVWVRTTSDIIQMLIFVI